MFGVQPIRSTQHVGFLLTPQFSLIAFTSAIEPLRAANRIARDELFTWELFTIDGKSVQASNGVEFNPNSTLTEKSACDILFVCSGVRSYDHLSPKRSGLLRALSRRGIPLGSMCTGTVSLAEAGLLDGYRCTIHWENIESLAERYPKLNVMATLFEADRNRFTCSGGMASMDMMIHSIKQDYGRDLGMRVADQMLYSSVREPQELQRMAIERRTGITHPKLLGSIGYMEAHIESPMAITEIAKTIGLSSRQLERLFQTELKTSPKKYYHSLRLDRSRTLLRQTPMPTMEIAFATGFSSVSYFTKSYKVKFGYSPRQERENL